MRTLEIPVEGVARPIAPSAQASPDRAYVWTDVEASVEDADEVLAALADLRLDPIAVRDALDDVNLPKVDDFGSSQVIVLHALSEDRIATFEVTAFLGEASVVTIRRERSVSVDLLWQESQVRSELTSGGPDELIGRLADLLTRRLLSVLEAFDERVEGLVADALAAKSGLIRDVTAVRADLAVVRHAVVPQREALDVLRRSKSSLISEAGRRRFSDVFDVAARAAAGVDAARTALAELLDAYRGAEARQATEVTRVLTIYAAIMLPLSLVAGFFGMNFPNLPWIDASNGWIIVTIAMSVVAVVSLGIFVALGWIHRPSSRRAASLVGRGLAEAARAPVQLVGAVLEIPVTPLRTIAETRRARRPGPPEF